MVDAHADKQGDNRCAYVAADGIDAAIGVDNTERDLCDEPGNCSNRKGADKSGQDFR